MALSGELLDQTYRARLEDPLDPLGAFCAASPSKKQAHELLSLWYRRSTKQTNPRRRLANVTIPMLRMLAPLYAWTPGKQGASEYAYFLGLLSEALHARSTEFTRSARMLSRTTHLSLPTQLKMDRHFAQLGWITRTHLREDKADRTSGIVDIQDADVRLSYEPSKYTINLTAILRDLWAGLTPEALEILGIVKGSARISREDVASLTRLVAKAKVCTGPLYDSHEDLEGIGALDRKKSIPVKSFASPRFAAGSGLDQQTFDLLRMGSCTPRELRAILNVPARTLRDRLKALAGARIVWKSTVLWVAAAVRAATAPVKRTLARLTRAHETRRREMERHKAAQGPPLPSMRPGAGPRPA